MSPLVDAFARSWPYAPWLWTALVTAAVFYTRGWRALHRRDARRWNAWPLASFLAGLLAVFAALGSPIEPFAGLLLQVHMLQHLLLLMVAPPLVWLGAPLVPLLRGLPRAVRSVWVIPLLRSPVLRMLLARLGHPAVAWPLFVATVWLWHTPRGYGLALDRPSWHIAEHACFAVAGLAFWYPVVQPYPSRPAWSRWLLLPYLIAADVQNTILSAWLAFSAVPIYAHYVDVPRIGGWSALADQQAAGVLMWVPGSIAFLVPVFWIGLSVLYGARRSQRAARERPLPSLPVLGTCAARCAGSPPPLPRRWDLLRVPVVGRLLRHRRARAALQAAMLALAAVVIADGLWGPRAAPANLAGVAPWIHWRGFVVLGLLAGGNFFCLACPFTLPRNLAARWLPAGRAWPRTLQSKWLAVVLVATFLWSYEAFALWDSPWLTAWIGIGYFVAAFAIDGMFRGAAFCKYVCPIGQFNFVQSLVSPLEVAVREPQVCTSCQTHACARGSPAAPGCGMGLFLPHKLGNFDCTFCLDCVRACPHDNVGVLATLAAGGPSAVESFRSGIGRLAQRSDVAVLAVVLVFGAFANAAGMIAPVVAWQDAWRVRLGDVPHVAVVGACYFAALVVAPTAILAAAAACSRALAARDESTWRVVTRYAYALVPIGCAMWIAHYGFHLFTSWATIVPVAERVAIDLGLAALGEPSWQRACCKEVAPWIVRFELVTLGCGWLGSLYATLRVSEATVLAGGRSQRTFFPWALVCTLLFAVGVWIVLEPMQMRGTLGG